MPPRTRTCIPYRFHGSPRSLASTRKDLGEKTKTTFPLRHQLDVDVVLPFIRIQTLHHFRAAYERFIVQFFYLLTFSYFNRSSAKKLAEKNLSQRFTIGITDGFGRVSPRFRILYLVFARRRRRRRFLAFQVSAESWILFNVINVSNRTRDATLKNRSIGRNEKNISRSRFSRFFIYIHIHIHVQRVRWEKPLDKCVEFLPGYAYDDFSFIEYHLFIVSDANERTANRVSTGRALKERRYCSSGKTTTRTSDFRESNRKKRIRFDLEVLVPG